ncbi:MAG: HAD family hydrolase [Lachnospiraceae bacterium]|jgi:phosphoglycolate phosphatase|nr:HAD family hydrolase [Lachnospiraceae bacterium]MCI8994753.1 HAD family hydrolase [Lachnospiraceae bacterium]MCI9133676.1 HAD family hydrolase [Lachnospiraceae bacterium]
MIRACIFDLDGTLCDSVVSIGSCVNHVLEEFSLPQVEMERFYYFVGDGVHQLVLRTLDYVGADRSLEERVQKRYLERFREECLYEVHAYPGISDMLAAFRKRGILLAVLSNKPHENTKRVVDAIFGAGAFDLVSGQQEGIPRKPDPAGALREARLLGVDPGECLYVGDTGTDMKTGNAAGMHTVGVLWGFRDRQELEENKASHLVGEPGELLQVLDMLEV